MRHSFTTPRLWPVIMWCFFQVVRRSFVAVVLGSRSRLASVDVRLSEFPKYSVLDIYLFLLSAQGTISESQGSLNSFLGISSYRTDRVISRHQYDVLLAGCYQCKGRGGGQVCTQDSYACWFSILLWLISWYLVTPKETFHTEYLVRT